MAGGTFSTQAVSLDCVHARESPGREEPQVLETWPDHQLGAGFPRQSNPTHSHKIFEMVLIHLRNAFLNCHSAAFKWKQIDLIDKLLGMGS